MARSSRSFIVRVPAGFSAVRRACWMVLSKAWRHRKYWPLGFSVEGAVTQNPPPMPDFEASVAAKMVGWVGTTVRKAAGVSLACVARRSQWRRISRISGVRRMRRLVVSVSACCRMEKECAAPYKAGVVLRSVPNNFCHRLRDVRDF
jgi:hypothetical protein